jgi:hypothetical protein
LGARFTSSVGPLSTRSWSPTLLLNEQNIVIFLDDLQKYVPLVESITTNAPYEVAREKIETLHYLLRTVRASAKRVKIIATCRLEDEIKVNSELGNIFEELEVIILKQFNQDINDVETKSIFYEFKKAGVEHIEDWDGTIGSLVLGLSRKTSIYHKLVLQRHPSAVILKAMKLLTVRPFSRWKSRIVSQSAIDSRCKA